MQQSNIIFGFLLVAFVVFITVRGELPTYLSLLRGSSANGNVATGLSGALSGAFPALPALAGLPNLPAISSNLTNDPLVSLLQESGF